MTKRITGQNEIINYRMEIEKRYDTVRKCMTDARKQKHDQSDSTKLILKMQKQELNKSSNTT